MLRSNSPFVSIPNWIKILIGIYFLIYSVLSGFSQLITETHSGIGVYAFVFLKILKSFLVLSPIYFFKRVGLLHLLVFPYLLGTLRGLIQHPTLLLSPLSSDGLLLETTALTTLQFETLLYLNIESLLYEILYYLVMYFAFLHTGNKVIRLKGILREPKSYEYFILSLAIISVMVVFFTLQGGITNWIVQWGKQGGRQEAMEGLGPILRLLKVSFIVPLIWFIFKGTRLFKNPYFLFLFVITSLVGFFATGSRSSLITGVLPFLMVYILNTKKIPLTNFALLGVVFFILFGLFGQIRSASTYTGGDFSWDRIDFNIEENINTAAEEANVWSGLGADIATYYSVPEKFEFLYGKTYVAFLAFWIPRAIWSDKPHGVGYYTGRLIFGGSSGVPPSPIAEAYWNFSIFGIIFIAFLHGILVKHISNIFIGNSSNKAVIVAYTVILTNGLTMTSLALTGLIQSLVFVLIFLKILRII